MSFDRNFGGLIWTNHALRRMQERGIKQGDAWVTWRRADQSRYGKVKGTWVYYRNFPAKLRNGASGHQRIEVVAKKNPSTSSGQAGKWIILSVWSRSLLGRKKSKKISFAKIFLDRLLGRK